MPSIGARPSNSAERPTNGATPHGGSASVRRTCTGIRGVCCAVARPRWRTTSRTLGVSWWRKGSPILTRSTGSVRCARSVTTARPRNANLVVGLPRMRSQFGHRAQPDQGVLPSPPAPDRQGGEKLAWLIKPFLRSGIESLIPLSVRYEMLEILCRLLLLNPPSSRRMICSAV